MTSSFYRRALIVALVAEWLLAGGAASGQRLLTLGPERPEPAEPGVLFQEARSDSVALPAARPSHTVEVDLDLVRSAPPRLELPTPDGRVLVADLTVFEDRGGGDVLWSGRFPGAAYDSVVLTIADGGMAGQFDEPFGEKHRIVGAGDGSGKMIDGRRFAAGGAHECGVGAEAGDLLHEHLARVLDRNAVPRNPPRRIVSRSGDDELKILVLYTRSAARNWEDPDSEFYAGSTRAALRNAADYLRMVFRNGGLGLDPVVVFEEAPGYLDRVAVEGETLSRADILSAFVFNAEPDLLRRRHGADLVHLFYAWSVVDWPYDGAADRKHGVTLQGTPSVFAHEVGHQLGGVHQPEVAAPSRASVRRLVEEEGGERWQAWAVYAFAHAWHQDGTPTPDGQRGDFGSAVAYPSTEPFYSTVRIRPGGRQLGIAGERENERAFRESVHDRAGWSVDDQADPLPPTNLEVQRIGRRSVRITWTDNSNDEDSFYLWLDPFTPGHKVVGLDVAADRESVVVEDLKPGAWEVLLFALSRIPGGLANSYVESNSYLEYGWFVVPGAEPAAPREVKVAFVPQPSCTLGTQGVVSWSETFTAEEAASHWTALEIQVFREGRLWQRLFEASGVETARIRCLDDGRYSLRMFAHSFGGRSSASRTVTLRGRSSPPPPPEPPQPTFSCEPGAETLCLHGDRYEVRVEWRTGDGETGSARVVSEATEDSGLFSFFDADNWEILIKVLNACAVNGHYWVYGASTTDLGYAIRVTDTATGDVKEYRNAPGHPAAAITDTRAFPDSCRP